jgi:CDGSH-type Zn-finger protein
VKLIIGAHEGTSFTPMAFTVEKDENAYLCACKHTKKPPYCDGSHQNL